MISTSVIFSDLPSFRPFKMRLCIYVVYLTGIIIGQINADADATPTPDRDVLVSHEDIRDAILSLIHMFRDNMDKLERHESRERQLGDQLKKMLTTIEKKQKPEESGQLLDTLNALSRRLELIETAIAKERSTQVSDSTLNFQQFVERKMADIEASIEKSESMTQKVESILSSAVTSMSTLDPKLFQDKLDTISTLHQRAVEEMTRARQSMGEYAGKENGNCQVPHSLVQKLDELRGELSQNRTGACGEQTEKTHTLINQNLQTILSAISATSDNKTADKKLDELLKEFKDLSKIEQVIVQTADNVLDTKRRVEYGTHQVLVEIGEMIKLSSKEINETMNRRFDTISAEILDDINGALQNLSMKLETEISQVWRQIGIMYQTLTNSADSLDKLQQQTEIYVNGSLSTLDSMEGKVVQITGRMTEVDENLNYLLGRLSLVTQEFNQIKLGLGDALDNIRKSFHTVQDKVRDVGPGPNPIEEDSPSESTPLQKVKYETTAD